MAIYVGKTNGPYISTTDTSLVVASSYSRSFGFYIKFKVTTHSGNYQHILNCGGRGTDTKMCLNLYRGSLSFELGDGSTNPRALFTGVVALNDYVDFEFLCDINNSKYILNVYINGALADHLEPSIPTPSVTGGNVVLFNCDGQPRPAAIDFYSLKIYNNYDLVSTITPYDVFNGTVRVLLDGGGMFPIIQPLSGTATFTAASDEAREVTKMYLSVNGTTKEVTKGYIGVNGMAKLFFGSATPPPVNPFANYTATYKVLTDNTTPSSPSVTPQVEIAFPGTVNLGFTSMYSDCIMISDTQDFSASIDTWYAGNMRQGRFVDITATNVITGVGNTAVSNPYYTPPGCAVNYQYYVKLVQGILIDNVSGMTNPEIIIPLISQYEDVTPVQPVTPLAFEVPTGTYNMSSDQGLLTVVFNQNIGLEQDTGEDPIQVMLDDGQGTIQSLVYYPGYSEELKVVDNIMYLDLKGGSFLADMPADVRLVIQEGVVFSTSTQEHLPYVESPVQLEITY